MKTVRIYTVDFWFLSLFSVRVSLPMGIGGSIYTPACLVTTDHFRFVARLNTETSAPTVMSGRIFDETETSACRARSGSSQDVLFLLVASCQH